MGTACGFCAGIRGEHPIKQELCRSPLPPRPVPRHTGSWPDRHHWRCRSNERGTEHYPTVTLTNIKMGTACGFCAGIREGKSEEPPAFLTGVTGIIGAAKATR
eukprot:s8708_g1.t1